MAAHIFWEKVQMNSPCVLHGFSLVQTSLDHRVQTTQILLAEDVSIFQFPNPLEGEKGVQTDAEVMTETPLQDHLHGSPPMHRLREETTKT